MIDEKKYRVLNYIVTLRAALNSLSAAAGIRSPREFRRHHAVYLDAYGRITSAEDLFPQPLPERDLLAAAEGEEEKPLEH